MTLELRESNTCSEHFKSIILGFSSFACHLFFLDQNRIKRSYVIIQFCVQVEAVKKSCTIVTCATVRLDSPHFCIFLYFYFALINFNCL